MIAALALAAAAALALPVPVIGAAAPAEACTAEAGSFTWGFKESFRAYISGSIANGEWSTEGDIGYATPAFFSDAMAGSVELEPLAGELGVEGAVRFTGHEGILDTTLSNLRLVVESPDRLVVVVDVRGTTQDFVPVDSAGVRFLTGDLTAAQWSASSDGLLIENIALTLTADGAEAFGTYPEGEPFDPLTLALASTEACATAALDARASADQVPLVVSGGLIAAGVGLGAVIAVVERRRSRATPATPAEPNDAPSDS
ncbi:HtaA domain-containing protein [Microcella sp.]|uniref:HtaA domain-containing protein n=1 Tax=Microcella sp. TaxID=1913979 RepID=UPI00299F55EB|nr:HtaA domain-containing protein [Microcella sp.]MDX2024792.1 HtaA domain-containing protein [Microcella sp.]